MSYMQHKKERMYEDLVRSILKANYADNIVHLSDAVNDANYYLELKKKFIK